MRLALILLTAFAECQQNFNYFNMKHRFYDVLKLRAPSSFDELIPLFNLYKPSVKYSELQVIGCAWQF